MNVNMFLQKIGVNNIITKQVNAFLDSSGYNENMLTIFNKNRTLFHQEMQDKRDPFLAYLTYYIVLAMRCMEKYKENKISEKIYWDTFSDIGLWAEKYYADTGKVGLAEYKWIEFHLDLELFTLGRLQFRLVKETEPIVKRYIEQYTQTFILAVHVAAVGKLGYNDVKRSYQSAHEFFRKNQIIFTATSWLLAPILGYILNGDSNIIKFQQDYTLLNSNYNNRDAENRIFGYITNDINAYPQCTSLQKNVKKLLEKGEKIPECTGVFINDIQERGTGIR